MLSFVGSGVSGTGAADPTVTLPGGIAQDDVVIVAVMSPAISDLPLSMITTGYTELADLYQDDTTDVNLGVYRKIMGATPDSTAQAQTQVDLGISVFHCWRGCDTTTPEDATTTTAQAPSATDPDPPAIDTATANAIVLAIGATSEADAITTAPSGYSNLIDLQTTSSNVMMSSKLVASPGTENPAAYTEPAGTGADCWCAATVAIRPAAEAVVYIPPPWVIQTAVQRAAFW